jgi:hypothetical protein
MIQSPKDKINTDLLIQAAVYLSHHFKDEELVNGVKIIMELVSPITGRSGYFDLTQLQNGFLEVGEH